MSPPPVELTLLPIARLPQVADVVKPPRLDIWAAFQGESAPTTGTLTRVMTPELWASHRVQCQQWLCAASQFDVWAQSVVPSADLSLGERARQGDRDLERAWYASLSSDTGASAFGPNAYWLWEQACPESGYHWIEGYQNPDHITRLERLLIHASFGYPALLQHLAPLWRRLASHAKHVPAAHFTRWIWWLCRGEAQPQLLDVLTHWKQCGGSLTEKIATDLGKSSALDVMLHRWCTRPWPTGLKMSSELFDPQPRPAWLGPAIAQPSPGRPMALRVQKEEGEKLLATRAQWAAFVAALFRLGACMASSDPLVISDAARLASQAMTLHSNQIRWNPSNLISAWPQWVKAGLDLRRMGHTKLCRDLHQITREGIESVQWLWQDLGWGQTPWWEPGEELHVIEDLLALPQTSWAEGMGLTVDGFFQPLLRATHILVPQWSPARPLQDIPNAIQSALLTWVCAQPRERLVFDALVVWATLLTEDKLEIYRWMGRAQTSAAETWDETTWSELAMFMIPRLIKFEKGRAPAPKATPRRLRSATEALHWTLYTESTYKEFVKKTETLQEHEGVKIWLGNIKGLGPSGGQRELARADRALACMSELKTGFPHFGALIEQLEQHLALAMVGNQAFTLPPLLLAGPPGTGKTFFFSELARHVNTAYHIFNMESINGSFSLTGMERGWGNSEAGMVFERLALATISNPIILLDELDKCLNDHYPVDPVLLTLLEPHSAARFEDRCVPLPLDLRQVNWVATANDLAKISAPLKSRFDIVMVPNPDLDARRAMARTLYRVLATQQSWGAFFDPQPTTRFIDALATPTGSTRNLRKHLTRAFAAAALVKRSTLEPADLPSESQILPPMPWDRPLPERRPATTLASEISA